MTYLESELQELRFKVMEMAELIQVQLSHGFLALLDMNPDLAREVLHREKRIDRLDLKIDKRCEKVLALYQPVAMDLRFVFSVIKINNNFELIGDALKYIAHCVLEFKEPYPPELLTSLQLESMTQTTEGMVRGAIHSFHRRNAEESRWVYIQDDKIDDINRQAQIILIQAIQLNPEKAEAYIRLLLVIQRIERIADYAVSIAREVVFIIEGKVYRHHKRDGMLISEEEINLTEPEDINDISENS
ncbi:MAG: phosphate transport system regulatory protein PhoU [Sphingobacteriia bacterium]|nr:phosphate transport system regulatory protein PhoU [Sphingobacteriia bacterium]